MKNIITEHMNKINTIDIKAREKDLLLTYIVKTIEYLDNKDIIKKGYKINHKELLDKVINLTDTFIQGYVWDEEKEKVSSND